MMYRQTRSLRNVLTVTTAILLIFSCVHSVGFSQTNDVNKLIRDLKNTDPVVRQKAAQTLGEIRDTRAVKPLTAAMKDKDSIVREKAAEALGEIKDTRAVKSLIAALKDEYPAVQKKAVWALGEIGTPAIEPLISALKDRDDYVRKNAVEALAKIGTPAVGPLIVRLKDENSKIRAGAASALGEIGDIRSVELLIAALKDENPDVRANAAMALGKINDVRAIEPLIVALRDENLDVKWWAVWALQELRNICTTELLIAALKDEDSVLRIVSSSELNFSLKASNVIEEIGPNNTMKLIRGTILDFSCEGHSLKLASNQFQDGFILTKDFGQIRIILPPLELRFFKTILLNPAVFLTPEGKLPIGTETLSPNVNIAGALLFIALTPNQMRALIALKSGSAQSQEIGRVPLALKNVLVLEAAALDDVSQKDASILSGELAKAISRIGNYQVSVKSSAELAGVFEEYGEAVPTRWDDSTQKKLGLWLKRDYIVAGTLGKTEKRRFDINLQLLEVSSGVILSTVHIDVLEYNHRLLLNRFAKLLFWARLQDSCNLPEYQAFLDGAVLQEENKDPDYEIWFVEPGKEHTLEVRARKDNYTTFKDKITLKIAERKTVEARLKYRMGVLEVRANPRADIYFNNKIIGMTPLSRAWLEGKYILKLKAGHHHDVTKTITIAPEETTRVQEILSVNYASYRRSGIITLTAAVLFVGGGLLASSEADKAYNRYLETMNVGEMNAHRDKAQKLDYASYASFGVASAFALWSAKEWIGLMAVQEPSQSKFNEKLK